MRLWDVETGRQVQVWEFKAPARAVAFAHGGKQAVCITDAAMGQPSTIHFLDVVKRSICPSPQNIIVTGSKATQVKWGPMNRALYTGHEDGSIAIYDAATCKKLKSVKLHTASIQDLQFAPVEDMGFFITASKDNSAMIYETSTLKVLKTFTTARPVNSASISPLRNHIILGGGQEAMNVTTTSQRHEKFEVFVSLFLIDPGQVFPYNIRGRDCPVQGPFRSDKYARLESEWGEVFLLILMKSFASGGEDGYVRVHHLQKDYFDFRYDEEDHPHELDL